MKTHFFIPVFALVLSFTTVLSCNTSKPKKEIKKKPKKHLTAAEKTDLERGSFDKLPDHNDSIHGCWEIDKRHSTVQFGDEGEVDGFFFFKEHKRYSVYGSHDQYDSFESSLGFYRFYNNELTFEITEGKPFQEIWTLKVRQGKIIAENKKNPELMLYLNRIKKKSDLRFK